MKRELPRGWTIATLADVVGEPQYGLSNASVPDGDVPIVGMKDITRGRIDTSALARTTTSVRERAAFRLQPGDLLLNRTNSRELVGKLAIWDHSPALEAVFASYLVRYPERPAVALPRYVLACLEQTEAQRQIERLITPGVSQANINPSAFYREVTLPLAPIAEQRRIVAALDEWDEAIDRTERLIAATRQRWLQTVRHLEVRNWKPVALGDLGRWIGGGTPSTSVAEYWTNGTIPWVSPKDMRRWTVDGAEDWISSAAVKASSTNIAPVGAVLVVTRSGILRSKVPVAVATREVAINQDIKALLVEPSIGRLCAALLEGNNERFRRETMKVGTTVESIDLEALKSFVLLMPQDKDAMEAAECLVVNGLVELDLLSMKLDAHRVQKQGLMEKLLTGEWRLKQNTPEATA